MKTFISIIAWTVGIMIALTLVTAFFTLVKTNLGGAILLCGLIWLVGGLLLAMFRVAKWGYNG